jgi:P-type E1-E2 ATPase
MSLTALTGRRPVLLTGDNHAAARALTTRVGVAETHAQLLPQDKVTHVRRLRDQSRRVLLAGDGVNDAPAMAAAHVGVAMGRRGSDLALQTADAVLVRDDLSALPALLRLSRRTRRVVVANLFIAAIFITVLVAWDLLGHLPLPLGVAGHEGSTVIVGLNGLWLLRKKAWRLDPS